MKIVLATGIYPPDIGGPSTYVAQLAGDLARKGHAVTVITYAWQAGTEQDGPQACAWKVVRVRRRGVILRWVRFARALRRYAADAECIECFSSVSTGIPLRMARLRGPKTILRLGGDFLWERWTDAGGEASLAEWYAGKRSAAVRWLASWLLRPFDCIVFSSELQRELYRRYYPYLPPHTVIENAVPAVLPHAHTAHTPFRLLFLGRLVAFKNVGNLLQAVAGMDSVTLTIAGSGPREWAWNRLAEELGCRHVAFIGERHGNEKLRLLLEHDLLVLPSLTEISPHVALEARAAGLPVLLTQEHGLPASLSSGMLVAALRTPSEIRDAITHARRTYSALSAQAMQPLPPRSFVDVAGEHLRVFSSLLS